MRLHLRINWKGIRSNRLCSHLSCSKSDRWLIRNGKRRYARSYMEVRTLVFIVLRLLLFLNFMIRCCSEIRKVHIHLRVRRYLWNFCLRCFIGQCWRGVVSIFWESFFFSLSDHLLAACCIFLPTLITQSVLYPSAFSSIDLPLSVLRPIWYFQTFLKLPCLNWLRAWMLTLSFSDSYEPCRWWLLNLPKLFWVG